MTTTVEYRVRPVTRYIVTRYTAINDGVLAGGRSSVLGMFDRHSDAGFVAEMCSKSDPNATRIVWEPHEQQPQDMPDERYAVGGDLHGTL